MKRNTRITQTVTVRIDPNDIAQIKSRLGSYVNLSELVRTLIKKFLEETVKSRTA